ncbi:MAG: nucleotidyltransferase domain-containing protein [Thermoproteota archaeon]|nr:nucleotidyltransferase domain-containing protein [Thermoproteota archaeon]
MSNISQQELEAIGKCICKLTKGPRRKIIAACIYGSRVAGYCRPDSDIDLLVVLENYPYVVKYMYFRESSTKVSVLAVDREALLRDAQSAFLGEFVVGRLLHIYKPIANAEFLAMIEQTYKRRVILEEIRSILESTGELGTEIIFPLEFVAFSKIRRRMSLYASAAYSYYKTYTTSKSNIEFALEGYNRAITDIIANNTDIFALRQDGLLQISDKHIFSEKKKRARLKLTKRLQEFNSYLVHTYAGRKIIHFAVNEAESKIRRRVKLMMKPPDFMLYPRKAYWRLPEGRLIVDSGNWLDDLARDLGNYSVSEKRRLGNKKSSIRSTTTMYVIKHGSGEYKIAVKEIARSKALKWAMAGLWNEPARRYRMDPLFRLGSEYKAIRYIRSLGLHTPIIEAVVLDRRLLVTGFVDGMSLADVVREYGMADNDGGSGSSSTSHGTGASLISKAGAEIAKVHAAGSTFGNIKPENIIVSGEGGDDLYFTDVEQFIFNSGDPAWDVAQFISWTLKSTGDGKLASTITKEFIEGYMNIGDPSNISRLAKGKPYIESFYPVRVPSMVHTIKEEINAIAG